MRLSVYHFKMQGFSEKIVKRENSECS